jgi:hypothetical protein
MAAWLLRRGRGAKIHDATQGVTGMAFTIRCDNGYTDAQAEQLVAASFTYLKRSALAKSILDDLEANAEVCIAVVGEGDPYYAHPESSYRPVAAGGTAVWNPKMSIRTTDSKNFRPDVAWVPQHREQAWIDERKRGLSLKLAKTFGLSETRQVSRMVNAHKLGVLSSHMCLMHELGHALQYATCRDDFLRIKGDSSATGRVHAQSALEETNLAGVEIPVALELNQFGANETPRWVYGHTDGVIIA